MITTSYESFSSGWRRHMRRLRKMSRMRQFLLERSERVHSHRSAAEVRGGVRNRLPHVAAERPAEQHQEAVALLAQHVAGRARHRAGAESVRRCRLRAEV